MHEMLTRTFKEYCNRDQVLKAMSKLCRERDEYHNGISRITWYDDMKPFDSEDEAYDWIVANKFGDYEQIAVPFYTTSSIDEQVKGHTRLESSLKKAREMDQKAQEAFDEYRKIKNADHFKDLKSEFIGCKNCGSKIARKYLKTNRCPVCGNDLRPQSLLDRIAAKDAKAKEYRKKASTLMKELEKKLKRDKLWLVKIEYHC